MIVCPCCQHPATKCDGYETKERQRYSYRPCHRDFTARSTSTFSGYRRLPDVMLTAIWCYAPFPLLANQVVQLWAGRNIEVSPSIVLNWVQTFGCS